MCQRIRKQLYCRRSRTRRPWERPFFLCSLCCSLSLSLHTALPSWPGQARLSNHQYFYSHALPCIFKGLLMVLENYSKILILANEVSDVNFLKKPWQMLFSPSKILLSSAILQYKKNRQEFRRIFKEQKSIGKGFKINVGS